MIKDQMDKKFGSPWHVIVGKGFAYEISYEVRPRLQQAFRLAVDTRGTGGLAGHNQSWLQS
jgi:hypothetical protein